MSGKYEKGPLSAYSTLENYLLSISPVEDILKTKFIVSDPLQSVDMSAEMAAESMEIVTMAIDKHQATKNYEVLSLRSFGYNMIF